MGIPDHATPEGTDRFRRYPDLWLSWIGLGTYLGDEDDRTDRQHREALALVGMKGLVHVEENMVAATVAPARPDDVHRVVRRHG